MRVLVATSPGHGHTFATVPLAWALRAAGHEVLYATAGRLPGDLPGIVGAGLPVAAIATAQQMAQIRAGLRARTTSEAQRLGLTPAQIAARNVEESRRARHVLDGNGWAFATRIFGPMSAGTLDGLVEVATRWRPDLVVHESTQGGGPLVAALLGVPSLEHPIGFARGPELSDAMAGFLADDYARHDVKPPRRTAAIDVSPASMGVGPEYGWPMRYVPFNGGGLVGEWLRPRDGDRPQVVVTLGTVLPDVDPGGFAALLEAAAATDAGFLFTASEDAFAGFGPLPPNVRCVGYVPLGSLLATADAIVHHGGSSTTMTSLDAGVPQLVLPQIADQFINADAVARRGCGLVVETTQNVQNVQNAAGLDAGPLPVALQALIGDEDLRTAAREVKAEMAGRPSPARTADRLIRWTLEHEEQTDD